MLFWILAVTIPIYAGALYLAYQTTARRLEAGAERDADELAGRLAAGLDGVIRPIEGGIRTVAHQLEEVDPPRSQYEQRIRGILSAWPDVYGSTIAVETGNADGNLQPFAPYLFRRGDSIGFSDLARDSYAYRDLPWYRRAADSKSPVWSLPYFDAGGGETWMVTYSMPFFRRLPDAHRELAGVVTADLDLNWVKSTAAGVTLGSIGMGWLSSPPSAQPFVAPIGATDARVIAFDASIDAQAFGDDGERMLASGVTFELLSDRAAEPVRGLEQRQLDRPAALAGHLDGPVRGGETADATADDHELHAAAPWRTRSASMATKAGWSLAAAARWNPSPHESATARASTSRS